MFQCAPKRANHPPTQGIGGQENGKHRCGQPGEKWTLQKTTSSAGPDQHGSVQQTIHRNFGSSLLRAARAISF